MDLHLHGHDHTSRSHDARRESDRRSLAGALALIIAVMVAEIVAGLLAGSLALLADAGHMLTDALALVMALAAVRIAARPAAGRWTYGLGRVEVVAALVNGASLLIVGLWITVVAVGRLVEPVAVNGVVVVAVASAGALANLAAASLLARGSKESINVRAAFLHVSTDLAAFVGTALAGALVLLTGWYRFDPVASLVVAALCFGSAYVLLRDSVRIILEGAPREIDPASVGAALVADGDVNEVHDLHIWTVTSGFPALSAHVLVKEDADCHGARSRLDAMLRERFALDHTTLQVEHVFSPRHSLEFRARVRREYPIEPH